MSFYLMSMARIAIELRKPLSDDGRQTDGGDGMCRMLYTYYLRSMHEKAQPPACGMHALGSSEQSIVSVLMVKRLCQAE